MKIIALILVVLIVASWSLVSEKGRFLGMKSIYWPFILICLSSVVEVAIRQTFPSFNLLVVLPLTFAVMLMRYRNGWDD